MIFKQKNYGNCFWQKILGAEGGLHLGKGLENAGAQLKNLHLDLYFNNITAVGAESLANGLGKMT